MQHFTKLQSEYTLRVLISWTSAVVWIYRSLRKKDDQVVKRKHLLKLCTCTFLQHVSITIFANIHGTFKNSKYVWCNNPLLCLGIHFIQVNYWLVVIILDQLVIRLIQNILLVPFMDHMGQRLAEICS